MKRSFKIITAPETEPITLAEAKIHAGLHSSVTVLDSTVEGWIKAGRIHAEGYQHRAYITQTIELAYDSWWRGEITLPRPPLIAVNSIKYYNYDDLEYELDSSVYQVSTRSTPGRIKLAPGQSFPSVTLREMDSVIINYTAGYGAADDIPETVKAAINLFVSSQNENRIGEDGELPPAIKNLLQPDRIEDR